MLIFTMNHPPMNGSPKSGFDTLSHAEEHLRGRCEFHIALNARTEAITSVVH